MACQVPVISTNTGGLPEINIHNETGFMADVGDTATMATLAVDLLQDESRLKQFKQNAYEQAQRFSIEKIVPMYEAYYEKVRTASTTPIS